jgi:diacylglycerol kinase family enzyme
MVDSLRGRSGSHQIRRRIQGRRVRGAAGIGTGDGVLLPSASVPGQRYSVLLIVNSTASSVTARTRVVIQKALAADHEVTVAETSRRGHATRLAQGAAAAGTDVVVVLGGDGTLNEAANGLAGTSTALAALPGGSTNVFCRTLGLPDDPVEATGALLDALSQRSIHRVGLGSANGRYFLFHVGLGFDAAVVARVERRDFLKRWASHAWFAWCAVDTWLRHYDRSRPRFAVHHSDGIVVDDAYFALVLNTNPYTYVGRRPFNAAPDATLDRGLAVLTFRTLALLPLLGTALSALGSGERMRRGHHTDYRTDVDVLRVSGHGPFPYQIDGDYLGECTELQFRHEPEVLDLVMPR